MSEETQVRLELAKALLAHKAWQSIDAAFAADVDSLAAAVIRDPLIQQGVLPPPIMPPPPVEVLRRL